MRLPAVTGVARGAVFLFPLADFRGRSVERDLHKARQIFHPPTVRFALEHLVLLHHGVQVLHAGADELEPLVVE